MTKLRTLPLITMVALLFLASCREVEPLASEEPIVTLLSPTNGSTLAGGDVQVRIYVQNFTMVEASGQSNKKGEGHAIYYLDATAPLSAGTPATTSPGSFFVSTDTSFTWKNVSAGERTFTVQLVNNDETPLLPPVTVRANVTLKNR